MRPILRLVVVLFLLSSVMTVPAQDATSPGPAEMMKRIEFLAGSWSGEGWMMFGPGQKRTFTGTETVTSKLDGTVLVIEGLHKAAGTAGGPERVIHNALAVVSYDPAAKKFRFNSYLADGRNAASEAEAPEKNTFIWWLKDPRGGTTRFTITLNEKGEWFEIGEHSSDGKTWQKFFEMTMRRAK